MTIHSYQAITTRYIGPSNFRGSRVKAKAAAGSVTLHWDDALNTEQNHAKAAKALADKLEWSGKYHMGGLPDDRGYVFVCAAFNDATLAFGE